MDVATRLNQERIDEYPKSVKCTQDWVRKSRKAIIDDIDDILNDDDVAREIEEGISKQNVDICGHRKCIEAYFSMDCQRESHLIVNVNSCKSVLHSESSDESLVTSHLPNKAYYSL
ncbi:hypothetical protein Tco_0977424 [Tanacetum coccineum]|uniref:Uncharacterized protein n=1 Tax=Tanacetum coccineum TaxID=301880 RepID=A0ABQ5EL66_9ASTR